MIDKIHIIDNIIDLNEQEKVKNTILGNHFNWHYLKDISCDNGEQKRPGFSHYFILKEKINSETPSYKL